MQLPFGNAGEQAGGAQAPLASHTCGAQKALGSLWLVQPERTQVPVMQREFGSVQVPLWKYGPHLAGAQAPLVQTSPDGQRPCGALAEHTGLLQTPRVQ